MYGGRSVVDWFESRSLTDGQKEMEEKLFPTRSLAKTVNDEKQS